MIIKNQYTIGIRYLLKNQYNVVCLFTCIYYTYYIIDKK